MNELEIENQVEIAELSLEGIDPLDIEIMFAGKTCDVILKNKTRLRLVKTAYEKRYPNLPLQTLEGIDQLYSSVDENFEKAKKSAMKIAAKHPLWKRFKHVKGLSSYQLALVMSYIGTPARFDKPSKLCVWAGIASINDQAITKGNIKSIQQYYKETGKGEFKGFKTDFSGRLFVIGDCFIRGKGYFYRIYETQRKRIEQREINKGNVFEESGRFWMKGRNKQSLDHFAYSNAKRRMLRTFLHLLWVEWRIIKGLPVVDPYAIDYLGHSSLITLDDVINFDIN